VRIPHKALAPDTLRNLVEEFVTREGTDYGEREFSLDDKVAQVLRQLEEGKVVLLYDPANTSCQLEIRERVPQYLLDDSDEAEP
jgi:Uncharacterized protein conserved in bacteria